MTLDAGGAVGYDAEQLRRYARAMESTAWSHQDSSEVRKIADRLASVVDPHGRFGLKELAIKIPSEVDRLPTHLPYQSDRPAVPRDHRTDAALEAFMRKQEAAIDEIERQQARIAENAALSLDDSRELFLRTVAAIDRANGGQPIWTHDVQWESNLSSAQVRDAVEHWLEGGELRSAMQSGDHDTMLRRWRVTPRGRDRASKGPPTTTPLLTGINVAGNAAIVQQMGTVNIAHIQQAQLIEVQVAIAKIRERLDEFPGPQREEIREYLGAIEDEANGAQRPSRMKALFSAIGQAVKGTGDALGPWIEAVVSGVVGGLS